MKMLVFTTLYPNSEQPNHGLFVEKRLLEFVHRYPCEVRVVAPVPWFPGWLPGQRYAALAKVPRRETRGQVEIFHPRYLVIPKLTWRVAPLMLVLGSILTIRRLRAEGFDFDLIDAHFVFPDGVAAQMIGRLVRKPVCMTARGSDINDSLRFWLPRRMIRWAVTRAKAVIAVSEELAKKMRGLCGELLAVHVLPNGVDRTRFYPRDDTSIADRLGLSGPIVLTVGNLRKLKGHEILIRAVAMLNDVSLVIIGAGEEEKNLRRLIEETGMQNRVFLLGAISNKELPDYYSAADVFALASRSEGCPNVVLEAIACGTPVVATAVGGIPDLVPVSCRHLLVTERSPEAFAQSIATCLSAPPSAKAMAAHAEKFDWESTCQRLKSVTSLCVV